MRPVLVILAVILWLVAQYDRIYSLQQCPFAPIDLTPGLQCDCEKQSTETSPAPVSQDGKMRPVAKPRQEDPCTLIIGINNPKNTSPAAAHTQTPPTHLLSGHAAGIFQPPRA